jgi:hypothetical protein
MRFATDGEDKQGGCRMIQRIEPGWVPFNDALLRPYQPPRRRPNRSKDEKGKKDQRRKPRREEAIFDIVA